MKFGKVLLAAVGGMCLLSGSAMVNSILPTFTGVTGSGPYTWGYDIAVTSQGSGGQAGSRVQDGDFFTIYDIFGLQSRVITSIALPLGSAITSTEQNVGITPAGTLPSDDPAL